MEASPQDVLNLFSELPAGLVITSCAFSLSSLPTHREAWLDKNELLFVVCCAVLSDNHDPDALRMYASFRSTSSMENVAEMHGEKLSEW